MLFSCRIPLSVQFRIVNQSTNQLGARKYKTNNVFERSIQAQEDVKHQIIKQLEDIPSPPKHPLFGHLGLISKHLKSQHKLHEELRKKYGNIVLISLPGTKMVAVYGPEEGKSMYANEGKYPIIGGFEIAEFFRYVY